MPAETRVLIAPLDGVGRDYPLSIEKLCPVLSFYVVKDWREGCERCKQILRYGGMGHTMSIHSQNDQIILEFGLKKPAFRIVVNSPTTFGSIGLTTGLDPAMTLGCGGYGGNITSDNISPRHLLNIKRLAYEIKPVANRFEQAASPSRAGAGAELARPFRECAVGAGSSAGAGRDQRRRSGAAGGRLPWIAGVSRRRRGTQRAPRPGPQAPSKDQTPLDFVCEDDVRRAIKAGQKLVVSERAIVTPAARDLGEQHRVFTVAPWRG